MEALRLAQIEIDKLRRRREGLEATVDNVEMILREPHVARAIEGIDPSRVPGIAPGYPNDVRV